LTVALLSVLGELRLLMGHVGIFESSDFVADLNYFIVQSVLFQDGVFDYFGENSIGLNKFEGFAFEVD
jgi:hypothetical protein